MNWQYLIVAAVVLGALAYLGRIFWRVWVSKTAACHCGTRACGKASSPALGERGTDVVR